MLDTKAKTQPLTVRARIGTKQKNGLRTKLSSRTETFLIKMNNAVRARGSEAKSSPSSSRAAISSARRLVIPVGVVKLKTIPMPNKRMAMKIHLL